MSESNRFFINLSSFMLSSNETTNDAIFENVFNVLFDNILENERFQEAVSNSINTYNDEIFNSMDEFVIDCSYELNKATDEKCYICLECMEENEKIYKLECSHIFHKSCLDKSISHQHYNCPLCKHKIKVKKKINWSDEYENEGHKIKLISKNE